MNVKAPKRASHVIIGGESLFYDAKAPYEKSGMSIKGALEYDPENGLVKCHECGEFFKGLGVHLFFAHGINARQYKIRHGLSASSALVSESVRESYIETGRKKFRQDPKRYLKIFRKGWKRSHGKHRVTPRRTGETDNSRRICNLQIIDRIQRANEQLGRAPTESELPEFGLAPRTIRAHFGSTRRLFQLAGIQSPDQTKWKNSTLLAFMKNFIQTNHREPGWSDCDRGLLPSRCVYERRFGSLRRAILLARNRKISTEGLPTHTRIRPVAAAKQRARQRKRFWGVNIGKFAIAGLK